MKTDREIAEAATPGPWKNDIGDWCVCSEHPDHHNFVICDWTDTGDQADCWDDMEFIAHFNPDKIKKMLDVIEKAERFVKQAYLDQNSKEYIGAELSLSQSLIYYKESRDG